MEVTMARVIRDTRVVHDDAVPAEDVDVVSPASTVARVVYLIAGVIITLLAFRFVLSLFGANRANPFADFIYSTSYPFAAPFFGLFNYQAQYGIARFEVETLVAMAVYAVIAWLIVYAVSVGSRSRIE